MTARIHNLQDHGPAEGWTICIFFGPRCAPYWTHAASLDLKLACLTDESINLHACDIKRIDIDMGHSGSTSSSWSAACFCDFASGGASTITFDSGLPLFL